MKRITAAFAALALAATFTACGGTTDTGTDATDATDATETAQAADATQAQGSVITINNARLVTDYEGKSCVAVSFDYTNNGDDSQACMWDFTVKAFQDNVELDGFAIVDMDEEWEEYESNYQMEVRPGTTITCCQVFILRSQSPVEIEAEPLFGGEKVKKSFTVQ